MNLIRWQVIKAPSLKLWSSRLFLLPKVVFLDLFLQDVVLLLVQIQQQVTIIDQDRLWKISRFQMLFCLVLTWYSCFWMILTCKETKNWVSMWWSYIQEIERENWILFWAELHSLEMHFQCLSVKRALKQQKECAWTVMGQLNLEMMMMILKSFPLHKMAKLFTLPCGIKLRPFARKYLKRISCSLSSLRNIFPTQSTLFFQSFLLRLVRSLRISISL
jgi:hypothetical protein